MRNIVRNIILVICIIVFLVSGGMLVKYYYTNYMAQKEFKELDTLKTEYSLEDLYKLNNDTFGWIYVKDTNINYPVMYTPDSPEYYLRKNFDKEYSVNGTPFVDGYTNVEESYNMIIYGHHIKSGIMFQNLVKFQDEGYYKEHDIITFDTIDYGDHKYQVFAFGETDALSEGFNVYNYVNITTKSKYDEYVSGLKELSTYDTGITPQYGQKIITLSTCSYHTEEGRYVVAAVEVE